MDHDYDNQIANVVDADDSGSVSAADILYGSVFVYSYGPDMANDAGRIKNAGNDDIVSWK